jgi:hypothetical protein
MNCTQVAAACTDHDHFRSPTDAFRKLDQGWVRAAPVRCDILLSALLARTLSLEAKVMSIISLHRLGNIHRGGGGGAGFK